MKASQPEATVFSAKSNIHSMSMFHLHPSRQPLPSESSRGFKVPMSPTFHDHARSLKAGLSMPGMLRQPMLPSDTKLVVQMLPMPRNFGERQSMLLSGYINSYAGSRDIQSWKPQAGTKQRLANGQIPEGRPLKPPSSSLGRPLPLHGNVPHFKHEGVKPTVTRCKTNVIGVPRSKSVQTKKQLPVKVRPLMKPSLKAGKSSSAGKVTFKPVSLSEDEKLFVEAATSLVQETPAKRVSPSHTN